MKVYDVFCLLNSVTVGVMVEAVGELSLRLPVVVELAINMAEHTMATVKIGDMLLIMIGDMHRNMLKLLQGIEFL